VGVQALEAARARARPADAEVELGTQAPLLRVGALEALVQLLILRRSARPALDAARRFQPGNGGDQMRARQPERRRERFAGVVVRRLLGDGGTPERAAHDDAPEGARRSA
jgi:hypothetical protein